MAKIQLDVAADLPSIAVYAAQFGLTHTVIAEAGPAGGNPLVEFQGTRESIEALVRDYDGTNGDFDWLMESVIE